MKPYLKKVEIKNYKTHRNTRIVFTDGINSIVGPNGVGKSNIIEAIIFALGERSLKTFRASSYNDLVYNNRKDIDLSVTLYIVDKDGNEHKFKRVYSPKKGGHKYRYNGKRVSRGSYIINLMKLGGEGFKYVYIQQGDILNKANATPRDIKNLVDDALGLKQYEEKRNEALKKLEDAEIRLRTLEEKYSTVQKFIREYLKEMIDYHTLENLNYLKRYLESGHARLKREELNEKLKGISDKRDIILEKLKKIEERLSIIEERHNKISMLASDTDNKLSKLETEEYRRINSLIEVERRQRDKIKSDIVEKAVESKHLKITISELKNQINSVRKEIINDKEQITRLLELLKNLNRDRRGLNRRFNTYKVELEKIENEHDKIKNEWTKQLEDTVDKLNYEAQRLAERIYIKERKEELKRIEDRERYITDSIKKLEKRKQEILDRINTIKKDIAGLKSGIDRLKRTTSIMKRELSDAEKLLRKLDTIISRLSSERKVVNEYSIEAKIVYEAVRSMEIKGVVGILGDMVKGPTETLSLIRDIYPRIWYSIIVKDDETAQKVLEVAKELKKKVSILILKRFEVKSEDIPGNSVLKLLKYPRELSNLMIRLFGKMVVASSSEEINQALSKGLMVINIIDHYAISPIELLHTSKKKVYIPSNLDKLVNIRKRFVKMIERRRGEYNTKLRELEKLNIRYRDLISRVSLLRNSIEFINIQLKYFREFERTLDNKRKRILNILKEKKRGKSDILIDSSEYIVKISNLEDKRREIRESLERIEEDLRNLDNEIMRVSSMIDAYKRVNQDRKNRIREYKENIKRLKERNEMIKREIMDKTKLLKETESRIRKYSDELLNLENVIKKYRNKLNKLRKLLDKLREKERKYENIRKKYERIELKLRYKIKILKEGINKVQEIIDRAGLGEVKLTDLESYDKIYNDILSEYGTYLDASRHAEERYYDHIDNYKMFSLRRKELYREKEEILKFISEIDKERERVFMEGFNKFKNRFNELFKEVFPGSKAYIELEDPENIDSDILVYIEFKDKPKLPLSALSGGEKTAIILMLLLSIYSIGEDTVFLLDEVDAHLDIRNIENMSKVIRAQKKYNQIILVTLPGHDSMISIADHIIAVAYRNGVSKVFTLSKEYMERMIRE